MCVLVFRAIQSKDHTDTGAALEPLNNIKSITVSRFTFTVKNAEYH